MSTHLGTQVVLFPTPTAIQRAHEGGVRLLRRAAHAGAITEEEAHIIAGRDIWRAQGKLPAMLPTAQVSTGRNNTSGHSNPESKHHSGETIYDLAYREGGQLCAAWVNRLMGFPDNWMDELPPDPLAIPRGGETDPSMRSDPTGSMVSHA